MVQDMRLIELKNISKSFGETQVLHNIDLYIRKCEFITLLGPSGCGKTTLLRIIGGFEMPDQGEVLFEGADMLGVPPYKRRINTVFQKYALFSHLNVFDNIAFGLNLKEPEALGVKTRRQKKEEIERRVRRMLRLVKMEGYEKRSIDQLSGGQQQRVALARTLTQDPRIILADEPVAALDPVTAKQVMQDFVRINREMGISILLNIHHVELAIEYADRIIGIRAGKIVYDGPSANVDQAVLDAIYGDNGQAEASV